MNQSTNTTTTAREGNMVNVVTIGYELWEKEQEGR
jgi:hypothetical protein